jgi:flagellar motor switch protein FliN
MSFEFESNEQEPEPAPLPGLEVDALLDLPLRVWAELGRARMPAARVVGMAPGTIVDLDRAPEDPADIYVNGNRFGTGRLLLVDGEWAVRIESIEQNHGEIEQMSSDGSAR